MINKTFKDIDGVELSIHYSVGGKHLIHLSDNSAGYPYDFMAYSIELEDIDEMIKQLKVIKKQMLSDASDNNP